MAGERAMKKGAIISVTMKNFMTHTNAVMNARGGNY